MGFRATSWLRSIERYKVLRTSGLGGISSNGVGFGEDLYAIRRNVKRKKSGSDSGTYVRLMTVLKTESREIPGKSIQQDKNRKLWEQTFLFQCVVKGVWVLDVMVIRDSVQ